MATKYSSTSRGVIDSSRTRALVAEGFNCSQYCVWYSTPWKRAREKGERSCSERGFGSVLCDDFLDRRTRSQCGECQYLHGVDPNDKKSCAKEYGRVETDEPCESFTRLDSSTLEFDNDTLIKHAGRFVDVLKYTDEPKHPVFIRFGNAGIIAEPIRHDKGRMSYRVTPVVLDENGELVLMSGSDAATARASGSVFVHGMDHIFSDTSVTLTPTERTYEDRIRIADKTVTSKSVRRIMKQAAKVTAVRKLPKRLVELFTDALSELGSSVSNATSMAASYALLMYDKEVEKLTPDEKRAFKSWLVETHRAGLLNRE